MKDKIMTDLEIQFHLLHLIMSYGDPFDVAIDDIKEPYKAIFRKNPKFNLEQFKDKYPEYQL